MNFLTTKIYNLCMCVNFAAVINREVGKVKFKFIKKCIFYHSLCRVVAMYAIVGEVNAEWAFITRGSSGPKALT